LPNQFAASLAGSLPCSGLLRLLRCGQGAEEHLVEILHVGEQFLDVDDSLIDDHAGDLARVRFVHLILDEGEEEVAHKSASLVLILGLTELLEVEALRQLPADLRTLDGVGEVHLRLVHGLLLVPWLLLVVHLGLELCLGLRLLVLVSLLLVLTLLALIVVATALIVVIATTTTALEVVASVVAAGAALAVLVLLLLVLPALRLGALVLLVVLTLVVVVGLGTLLLIVASLVLLAL
jgi:hypothetical protein